MSLRYRLFLWVSALFVIVAALFYFIENRVVAQQLALSQKEVRAKMLHISDLRRKNLQNFVAESIAEDLVRIDAVLHNILRFSPVALRFSPISVNEAKGTWGESADLLLEYKWIDFLQNTAEDRVIAMLAPSDGMTRGMYQIPIQEGLHWVYVEGRQDPYLGIQLPYFLTKQEVNPEQLEKVPGEIPVLLLLFDPNHLQDPLQKQEHWDPVLIKWTEGYALDIQLFAQEMQRAVQQKEQLSLPVVPQEQLQEVFSQVKADAKLLFTPSFLQDLPQGKLMEERLETIGMEYTQMNLIWMWMALFDSGVFGSNLFSPDAPMGIAIVNEGSVGGFGMERQNVLFPAPVFADDQYYRAHSKSDQGPGIATSFAVIPLEGELFLGNSAQFVVDVGQEERKGFLTLGVNTNALLERLIFAIGKTVFLVHQGKVFGAYGVDGSPLTTPPPSLDVMQQHTMGLIPWQGESYFYTHLQPFSEQDLHLLLLSPEKEEFALLRDLEEGSKGVADTILFNIHVTGFIVLLIVIGILHNLSRRITEPIVELAEATEFVAAGHYGKIDLKGYENHHKDEISQLYHAFEKMIVGLQEKEKVKGVLNKVVSSEIAQEILQGSVHLGGEEKRVSVLFADIRGFTHMTQHLPAKEAIELLNQCMTKLSHEVDKNQGVIDKYVGDEVMALFGAPLTRGKDALHAVKSGLAMLEILREWNEIRKKEGLIAIEVGIGIHTGIVCAGNMGAENRLNYTVIGRNVNLASRLCGVAKPMQLLVSQQTLDEVKEEVVFRAIEPMLFKGFDEPLALYEITALSQSQSLS